MSASNTSMPRSKRKLETEEEAATQTPRTSLAARSIPTIETQDLYDAMRRIEEEVAFGNHLRLQTGPGSSDDFGGSLRLPSPSQPPTSPRSLSCASTTYSLTRGLDDVGLDEEEPNQKRRAVRQGPLDALDRAQAALMRKLGACPECKVRKVKCTHFDRTAFEERYQAIKRGERALKYLADLAAASPRPSFNNGTATQIGSWQPPPLPTAPGMQHDEAQAEILAIEDDLRSAASPSPAVAPYYYANLQRFPEHPLGAMSSLPLDPVVSDQLLYPLAQQDDAPVPIGRRAGGLMWECRHGDDNTSEVVNEAAVCNLRFPSLPELCQHFQTDHCPFSRSFALWKCITRSIREDGQEHTCGFLSGELSETCLECDGNLWETWYYCTVIRTPSLTSGPSVRVGSRDGSMLGGSWPYHSPQAHTPSPAPHDLQMLFPGRYTYMGQNPGASYQSLAAKPSETKPKEHCLLGMPVYPLSCPYGKQCRRLKQPSEFITKGQFLVAVSVLSLVVMEQWLMASVSLIGSKGIVPAAVDVARNHFFWAALLSLLGGVLGMWRFKHARFRPAQNPEASSCHNLCLARGYFSDSPKLDIEDAGSICGDGLGADADGPGFKRSTRAMAMAESVEQ